MKKDEAISIISKEMESTKKSVEEFVKEFDKVVDILTNSLEVGDKVKLGSYITLEKVIVKERTRRNPSNGEEVLVPEHIEIKVNRTQALKDLIK